MVDETKKLMKLMKLMCGFTSLQSKNTSLKFNKAGGQTASGLALAEKSQHNFKIVTGFTLFEMIVAVAVFTFVVVATADLLIAAKNAQFKAAAVQNTVDNVRFALEDMTKEIRTGRVFSLISCNGVPNSEILFTNQYLTPIGFAFYRPSGGVGGIYRIRADLDPGGDCANTSGANPISSPMTSPDVDIDSLRIILTGLGQNDGQPRITFSFKAKSVDPKIQALTTMNLETTIVQRLRDPDG